MEQKEIISPSPVYLGENKRKGPGSQNKLDIKLQHHWRWCSIAPLSDDLIIPSASFCRAGWQTLMTWPDQVYYRGWGIGKKSNLL